MKNVYVLVISLLLLLFGGIFERNYINDSSQYILSDMSYIDNLINNGKIEDAKREIDALNDTWENIKKVWEIFIFHDEIDKIEADLIAFETYLDQDNVLDAKVYYEKLYEGVSHIAQKECLKLENIL